MNRKEYIKEQIKRYREQSRKAFAEYWEMSRQLTDTIARDDLERIPIMGEDMADLLEQAASAELTARHLEKELEGV